MTILLVTLPVAVRTIRRIRVQVLVINFVAPADLFCFSLYQAWAGLQSAQARAVWQAPIPTLPLPVLADPL